MCCGGRCVFNWLDSPRQIGMKGLFTVLCVGIWILWCLFVRAGRIRCGLILMLFTLGSWRRYFFWLFGDYVLMGEIETEDWAGRGCHCQFRGSDFRDCAGEIAH